MKRLLSQFLSLFLSLLVALGAPAGAQAVDAPGTTAARQQVLVMLRMPPQHFHADGAYGGGYNEDWRRSWRPPTACGCATTGRCPPSASTAS